MTAADNAALLILEIEALLPAVKGFLPLPNAVDEKCTRLTELYSGATAEARAAIRSAGTPGQYRVMLTFADRMAVLGVRGNDSRCILDALVAQAIEDFRWDPRENLMRLSLLRRSAEKIGADYASLAERVARTASDRAAEYLRHEPLRIEAFGFSESEGPEGFLYRRSW